MSELPRSKAPGWIYPNLASIGIYKTGGESWAEDTAKICANLSADLCRWAEGLADSGKGDSVVTTKLAEHWGQMTWANRFQEFVPDWSDPENIEAPLYELSNISDVTISMIASEFDAPCPLIEAYY